MSKSIKQRFLDLAAEQKALRDRYIDNAVNERAYGEGDTEWNINHYMAKAEEAAKRWRSAHDCANACDEI